MERPDHGCRRGQAVIQARRAGAWAAAGWPFALLGAAMLTRAADLFPHTSQIIWWSGLAAAVTFAIGWQRTAEDMNQARMAGAWESTVRPPRPGRDDTQRAAIRRRMLAVEERCAVFAAAHHIERVCLVLGGRRSDPENAGSSRHRRYAKIFLSVHWLTDEGAAHLPHLLEHELAHVRRRETSRNRLARTLIAGSATAAGLALPPASALAAVVTLLAACVVHRWWGELACDYAAVRRCGRAGEVAHWDRQRARRRAWPVHQHLIVAVLALRTHPPLTLRRLLATRMPARPVTGETLATQPPAARSDAPGQNVEAFGRQPQ